MAGAAADDDGDLVRYAGENLFIRTKEGAIRPFALNRVQRALHRKLEAQRRQTGRVRALVLKARQPGVSTYIEARFYRKVTCTPGVRAFILTHLRDSTDVIFEMVERFHARNPDPDKPRVGAANAHELLFSALDSGYRVGTAGSRTVGRGQTIQYFHGSEVAHWPNGGAFPAMAHEAALDRLTMLAQQNDEQLTRALRFRVSDPPSLSSEIPGSAARANRFLAFDADGAPIAAAGQVGGVPVSPFMATLLDDVTAAVARGTLGISLTGVDLHVRDFGAVGDGVADDTAAFAAAIAALEAGQRLRVACGIFVVTGIVFDKSGVLQLERGATLKLKANQPAGTKLLTIAADDVLVQGGTFDGNRAGQSTPSDQNCIYSTGRTNVHIDVDRVTGSGGDGVFMANATDCSVRVRKGDNTALNGVLWTYTGSDSVTRCITRDSFIDRSDSAANDQGCIKYTKSGSATGQIVGCAIVNCRAKMHRAPTGAGVGPIEIWGGGARNKVIGCDVEGGAIGISVANGQSHGLVVGCTTYDCSYEGIEIADSIHCTVTGNVVHGNGNTVIGISIDGATIDAKNTAVVGNTVLDITDKGISFYAGAPNSNATGNTIDVSGANAFGIYLNTSSNISLTGNAIEGNGTAYTGIVVDKSSNASMNGNAIKNFFHQAIQVAVDTTMTIDNITICGGMMNAGYIQFLASGGGSFGVSCQHVGIAGWAVGTTSLGNAHGDVYDWKNFAGNFRLSGGDPEGQLIAGVGSTCIRTDGPPGRQLWIKESGSGNTGWRQQSNPLTVEVTVTSAQLASAAKVTLVSGISGARFKLRNIKLSGAGTNFAGAGGDRGIAIQDNSGTVVWSVIPSATAKSLAFSRWGDTGLPAPAAATNVTAESTAGEALVATYSGGTTDYTSGALTLILDYERTA